MGFYVLCIPTNAEEMTGITLVVTQEKSYTYLKHYDFCIVLLHVYMIINHELCL